MKLTKKQIQQREAAAEYAYSGCIQNVEATASQARFKHFLRFLDALQRTGKFNPIKVISFIIQIGRIADWWFEHKAGYMLDLEEDKTHTNNLENIPSRIVADKGFDLEGVSKQLEQRGYKRGTEDFKQLMCASYLTYLCRCKFELTDDQMGSLGLILVFDSQPPKEQKKTEQVA